MFEQERQGKSIPYADPFIVLLGSIPKFKKKTKELRIKDRPTLMAIVCAMADASENNSGCDKVLRWELIKACGLEKEV